jgi:helix-turn-helix protein
MEKYVIRPEVLQKMVGKKIKDAVFNASKDPDILLLIFVDGSEISIEAVSDEYDHPSISVNEVGHAIT